MEIISHSFQKQQSIPTKHTCDGENVSPSLQFIDVPSHAKSLALVVDDPDAPMGTFDHWIVWNISPYTDSRGRSKNWDRREKSFW